MPAWFNAVWPVATFVLGLASTYLTSFITEKRQIAREAKARQAERDKIIIERRETFELNHLERLNEALHRLGRAAGQAHVADMRAARQTGQYASTLVGEEIAEEFRQSNRDVYMLRHLVLDEDLREKIDRVHRAVNTPSSMHRSDSAQAERRFAEAILMLDEAQADVAGRIRKIYLTAPLPELRA